MKTIGVIIVAGGSGSRMGRTLPKQFLLLGGQPVLARTINAFASALPGAEIVVVLPSDRTAFWRNLAARFEVASHAVAAGGRERFHSVRAGLAALKSNPDLIAVQDGVRPLTSDGMIRRTVAAAQECGTAVPVVEPVDSYRTWDGERSRIVDRRTLRIVQTPQVFRQEMLREAYRAEYDPAFTDDASVVEAAGYPVFLCAGERTNLKITTSDDLLAAEALLAAREEQTEEIAEEDPSKAADCTEAPAEAVCSETDNEDHAEDVCSETDNEIHIEEDPSKAADGTEAPAEKVCSETDNEAPAQEAPSKATDRTDAPAEEVCSETDNEIHAEEDSFEAADGTEAPAAARRADAAREGGENSSYR